jgi:hypothetical protein
MDIDVSFERWKQLTSLLKDENDSYDALIGRLLNAGSDFSSSGSRPEFREAASRTSGAVYKGVFLPDGTDLRAKYKGKLYYATISDGQWTDLATGEIRSSPSQAAYSITGGNVNGWLFWLVKRPEDANWQSLNRLRVRSGT